MPLAKQKASRDRIQFAHSLSPREVDVIVSDPEIRVLQCSAPVVTETWDLLNSHYSRVGPILSFGFMGSIKYLKLWQTRGLNDISVVSTLHGLQYLFLQSLKHVRSIPGLSRLAKLRRIWLENTKGLEDVSALQGALCLEEFIHTSAQNMRPTQYEVLQKIPTLKRVLVGFGSDKKNKTLETLMSAVGVEKYQHTPFVFV